MIFYFMFILWITVLTLLHPFATSGTPDYCEGETFVAQCSEGEVIFMTQALYGRMKLGSCLRMDYGNIGCSLDVLPQLDANCSGRRTCEVRVSAILDAIRHLPQSCPSDLRSYLTADYKCIKTVPINLSDCTSYGYASLATSNSVPQTRYIASVTSEITNLGSISCPWRLTARNGEQLNFTLYDFGTSTLQSFGDQCQQVYLTMKEMSALRTTKICSGSQRIRNAYISESNSVEIRIFSQEKKEKYFLLGYTVIGCADPSPPVGGFVKRNADTATIICNNSKKTWTITCVNNNWDKSTHFECADGYAAPILDGGDKSVGNVMWSFLSGAHEFSIALIASIAVIIACSILTVGLLCLKRHREVRNEEIRRRQLENEAMSIYGTNRKMDAHMDGRAMPGVPGDGYSPIENDYFRTWQMQRQISPSQLASHIDRDNNSYPPGQMTRSPSSHSDHIYESPKFVRKFPDEQYFELEPNMPPMSYRFEDTPTHQQPNDGTQYLPDQSRSNIALF